MSGNARRQLPTLRDLVHLLLLRPLLWVIFGINVRGGENLRGLNRFILISNHNSHLDTPLLYAALSHSQIRRTRPVAAYDHFSKSRWLFRLADFLFRPVWIDRSGFSGEALAAMQQALDDGDSLILFPEGTRGDPGVLRAFRGGIGLLVSANPTVPVVPAFLDGPERALPRRSTVPVPLWHHVTFAPPQRFEGRNRDITDALWETLSQMANEAGEARRCRPKRRTPFFATAVLGTDGSGKSTLATELARSISTGERTCLIGDRLETFEGGQSRPMQPVVTEELRRWMGARSKRAGSLGGYKLPKLAELLLRDHLLADAGRWYRPDSVFVDGMPALNLCAWSVLYGPEDLDEPTCAKALAILTGQESAPPSSDAIFSQFPELGYLRRMGRDHLRVPNAVIFLDVPPAVCIERIASRGEERQIHETEEKLAALRRAYLMVCTVLERDWKLPVLVLAGNRPREDVAAEARAFVRATRGELNDG